MLTIGGGDGWMGNVFFPSLVSDNMNFCLGGCWVKTNLLWFECCLLSDNPETKQIKLTSRPQKIGAAVKF